MGHAGLSARFFSTCGCHDGGETAGLHIIAGFILLVQYSFSAKPAQICIIRLGLLSDVLRADLSVRMYIIS